MEFRGLIRKEYVEKTERDRDRKKRERKIQRTRACKEKEIIRQRMNKAY